MTENVTKKTALIAIAVVAAIAFALGLLVGVKYLAPALTQHHYTTTIEKPTIVQGEVKTETKTQIAYVPKETIKYIDATGKEFTGLEKTDLDAHIAKADFNVKLNGKEIQFTRADDEKYLFEKNKIALDQTSKITIDATVSPTVIDNTRRWAIGAGYGTEGIAGNVRFPVGKNNTVGGWVYGDKKTQAAGLEVKF